jgi:hypothetical protein
MQVVRSKLMTVLSSQRPPTQAVFLTIYPKAKWLQSLHSGQLAQSAHLPTSTHMVDLIPGIQLAPKIKQFLTPRSKLLVR